MKINLLPQEFRPQPLISPARLIIVLIGSVLLVISLSGLVYQYFQYNNEKNNLANISAQLERQQTMLAEVNSIEQKFQEIKKRQDIINKILDSYPKYNSLLQKLAFALKSDIWLDNTNLASDGLFVIKGKAISFPIIGDYLKSLTQSDVYQAARLNNVSVVKEDERSKPVYTFEIEVKTGEGAPEYATKNQ